MAGLALFDRREQREAVDDLLDSVRARMSRTLVLHARSGRDRLVQLRPDGCTRPERG